MGDSGIKTSAFTDRIDWFIRRHNVMSLAVSDGAVLWAANVFYSLDVATQRLFYFTNLDTIHGRITQSHPVIAATIAPQGSDVAKVQGVQISGRVVLLHGTEADAARLHFWRDFPTPHEISAPIWALVPDYVKMVDNAISFGYKEEWRKPA